jgi:hypothetical protein
VVGQAESKKKIRAARGRANAMKLPTRVLSLFGLGVGRKPGRAADDQACALLRTVQRPLCIGASIGRQDGYSGSIGAFVEREGSLCLLSCSHVLTLYDKPDANTTDTDIYQAWEPMAVVPHASHRVAKLTQAFTLPNTLQTNQIDAAFAQLASDAQLAANPNAFPVGCGCNKLGKLGAPVERSTRELIGLNVAKFGRTTGYRTGKISSVTMQISLPNGSRKLSYVDLIEVQSSVKRPFSLPGDSGAVVFNAETGESLGLVMAGQQSNQKPPIHATFVCRMGSVLTQFKATLL